MEKLKISLSGIRGIIGEGLDDKFVFNLGMALAKSLKGKILVGRDSRPSGEKFSRLLIKAIEEAGGKVVNLGILPTPTLLLAVRKLKAGGGIIITASHNPSEWNGFKLVNSQGLFFNTRQFKGLLDNLEKINNRALNKTVKNIKVNLKLYGEKVIEYHIQEVIKHIAAEKIKKMKFKVGIDPVNGAGAVISRNFLERLNCKVYSINENPDGNFNRGPEPLPQNLEHLSRLVKENRLDLAFAQDPDADRLAVVSNSGEPIGEEYTLALAFKGWLNNLIDKNIKVKKDVVVNLATSRMVEDIAQEAGWKVWRTKVGEANVVEKMKEIGASFGGEGNGGVICSLINPARDSIVGMGLILGLVASENRKISELKESIPRYYRFSEKIKISFLKNADVSKLLKKEFKPLFKNYMVNFTDGIRVAGENFWWLIRPSNTEPVIRIMGETKSHRESREMVEILKGELKRIEKNF